MQNFLSHPKGRRTYQVRCAAAGKQQVKIRAQPLTPEAFKPFGQVIGPTFDGKEYDKEDAQLNLKNGIPRFYIMNLPQTGLTFDRITHHAKVTQCLAAVNDKPWYLAVVEAGETPSPSNISIFKMKHGHFVKLHESTWHAGPLFDCAQDLDFYNLELSDTNVVDHTNHHFSDDGIEIAVED